MYLALIKFTPITDPMIRRITALFVFVILFQIQQMNGQPFQVADGLEASLFASESQLFNPASIDADDRGRVWLMDQKVIH
ncbi:MAG: hypothetical protein ACI92G_003696 [Candidatus Pelagisphaera sp.]|jgi:hypothetical protein